MAGQGKGIVASANRTELLCGGLVATWFCQIGFMEGAAVESVVGVRALLPLVGLAVRAEYCGN
jgi:hypothetical protein